jgi:hypothetical protein
LPSEKNEALPPSLLPGQSSPDGKATALPSLRVSQAGGSKSIEAADIKPFSFIYGRMKQFWLFFSL